jgi:hypothetical protein
MILGHAHPLVVEAIQKAAERGTSFGASTGPEADLAELVIAAVPSMEKLRFVNSGTEATMSAIRVARGFTKRKYVIKFEGCYHGHSDGLLVKAGSGLATFGLPGSAGVPEEIAHWTLALPFNDLAAVREAFAQHPDEIACVIVEPVVGNMGVVAPAPGYLEGLRQITDLPREDYRRRATLCRVWREGEDDGFAGSAGAGLPSRDVERESFGDGGWSGYPSLPWGAFGRGLSRVGDAHGFGCRRG